MIAVHLHGRLGNTFGKLWNLEVKSPAEALRAIEARTNKLFKYLYDGDKRGIAYRVVIGGEDVEDVPELMHEFPEDVKDIHFYPQPMGSAGVFKIILGIILIIIAIIITIYTGHAETIQGAVSFLGSSASGGWGAFFAMAGVAMVVSGVAEMIIGSPKLGDHQQPEDKTSYYFNGVVNNMRQGGPIPIGYGYMIVGSQVISLAIRTEKIAIDSLWTPQVGTTTTLAGGGYGGGGVFIGTNYRDTPVPTQLN